tara:strand:- start:2386 stop:3162 length:777 start_codon:yes stop_codon:yes gene_type:complete
MNSLMCLYNVNAKTYTIESKYKEILEEDPEISQVTSYYENQRDEYLEEIFKLQVGKKSNNECIDNYLSERDGEIETIELSLKRCNNNIKEYRKIPYDYIREELIKHKLVGFGFIYPIKQSSKLEVIPSDLWHILHFDMDKNEVFSDPVRYRGVLFQYAEYIPRDTMLQLIPGNSKDKVSMCSEYYISPYLKLMNCAIDHFKLDVNNIPTKKEIVSWLEENSYDYGLEKLSDRIIQSMATLLRPPESQKGGYSHRKKEG